MSEDIRTHPDLNARVLRVASCDPPVPWGRWVPLVGRRDEPDSDVAVGLYPFRWMARFVLWLVLQPKILDAARRQRDRASR